MNVNWKIVEVAIDTTIAKNGGGSYKGTRIAYRDGDGTLKEKGIHSNALKYNPNLKKQLEAIKAGDDVTVVMEKEGEYWNIKEVLKGTVESVPAAVSGNAGARGGNGANVSPKSTYETPEERAKKQVYIVRQSSIAQAITFLQIGKAKEVSVEDVLKVATQFESHVFGTFFDDGSPEAMESDIL